MKWMTPMQLQKRKRGGGKLITHRRCSPWRLQISASHGISKQHPWQRLCAVHLSTWHQRFSNTIGKYHQPEDVYIFVYTMHSESCPYSSVVLFLSSWNVHPWRCVWWIHDLDTMQKQIFGVLEQFCLKWLLDDLLSMVKTISTCFETFREKRSGCPRTCVSVRRVSICSVCYWIEILWAAQDSRNSLKHVIFLLHRDVKE